MWTKVLFDLGYIGYEEPYKRLVNQGMIQGSSRYVFRLEFTLQKDQSNQSYSPNPPIFVSKDIDIYDRHFLEFLFQNTSISKNHAKSDFVGRRHSTINVDVNIVDGLELDIEAFRKWRPEYENAEFLLEGGKYICGDVIEKMSKSKFNTVNPNDLVDKFGADTFRMYEMFLGPVEASKPWDTKGIEGVHRFLKKLWRLFYDEMKGKVWNNDKPTAGELKILHRAIKKIEDDTERFSFNTAVSTFMICVNELNDAKCHKKEILEQVLILLTPYAPHIAEELWHLLGNAVSILDASYPVFDARHTIESSKEYPVSINGRVRTNISIALNITESEVAEIVLANETVQKWLEGKSPKKIIYVPNKMVNVVV